MSGIKSALLLLLLLCSHAGVLLAKEGGSQFCGEVNVNATFLKITSKTATEGMWLGVTFYPPKERDTAKGGMSQVLALKKGHNSTVIAIPERFKNGTFEAALWGKKLSKREIPASDVASQNLGYKLTGMVSYLWGYLTAP